jgi:hypothetical protein
VPIDFPATGRSINKNRLGADIPALANDNVRDCDLRAQDHYARGRAMIAALQVLDPMGNRSDE